MLRAPLAVVLTAMTLVGCERSAGLSSADLEQIEGLRRSLMEAIEAGDADRYADLCTEDVQLLHSDAPLISGRAELRDHNAAIFEAVTVVQLRLSPVHMYGVEDLAYEVGTQELAVEPTTPRFRQSRKYVHVLRRSPEGQWRFAALISNNS